jgi:hypothetical protein
LERRDFKFSCTRIAVWGAPQFVFITRAPGPRKQNAEFSNSSAAAAHTHQQRPTTAARCGLRQDLQNFNAPHDAAAVVDLK